MFTVKLLKWLRKNAGAMSDSAFARFIGLAQSNVSRHRGKEGPRATYDPRVSKLVQIAKKLRPSMAFSEVIAEIEKEASADSRSEEQRRADAAYQVWLSLFESDPARGERVLANLNVQELLGITDQISRVVNTIVTQHDQVLRMRDVQMILSEEEKDSRGKRFQKIAAEYAAEYERYK